MSDRNMVSSPAEGGAHLDDEEVANYVDGALPSAERARLRGHIDICAECREVIAEALRLNSDPDGDGPAESLGAKRYAGRYEIANVLGMGAMGVVYAALDPELGRRIAIKLLRPASDDPRAQESRRRFVREAKSLARVVHPNVVSIYDVGQIDDQIFIAMELCPGGTLRDWLAKGPHSFETTLQMFVEIGRGLGAVHKAGLVHRDFKPENILLTAEGHPRVTDFGLARLELEADDSGRRPNLAALLAHQLTQTGAVLGTPAYMAPEQLRGRPVDVRSDIFAFCVALHEALVGVRPFAGTSVTELVAAIERQAWVRTNIRLPRALTAILERGLAADPAARYPTLDPLLADLQQILRPPRRLGRRVAVIATIMLATSTAVGVGLWRAQQKASCQADPLATVYSRGVRERLGRDIAAVPIPAAPSIAEHVQKALDRYAEALRTVNRDVCEDTYVRRQASELTFDTRMQCLGQLRHRMELFIGSVAEERARLVYAPTVASNLDDPNECRREQATTRLKPQDEAVARELANRLDVAANDGRLGRQARARQGFTEVATRARAARLPRIESEALISEAITLVIGGGKTDARTVAMQGIAVALSEGQLLLASRGWLEIARAQQERLDETLQALDMASFVIARARDGQYEPSALASLASQHALLLAGAYFDAGQSGQAETILRAALERPLVPATHRQQLENLLGSVLIDRGKLAEADALLTAAAQKTIDLYGPDSIEVIDVGTSRTYLAYVRDGAKAAIAPAREQVAAVERLGDEHPSRMVTSLTNLASYLSQANQDAEALAANRRAAAIAEQKLAETDPRRLQAVADLGTALLDTHRDEEARPILERAWALLSKNGLADSVHGITLRRDLARALWKTDRAHALHLLDEATTIGQRYPKRADVQQVLKEIATLRRTGHP